MWFLEFSRKIWPAKICQDLPRLRRHQNMSCRTWAIAIANIYDERGKSKLIYRASILPVLEGSNVVVVELMVIVDMCIFWCVGHQKRHYRGANTEFLQAR